MKGEGNVGGDQREFSFPSCPSAPAVTSLSPPTSLCPPGPPPRHQVTSGRESVPGGEQPLRALGVSGTTLGTPPGSPLPSGATPTPGTETFPSLDVTPTIPSPPCSPRPAFPAAETPQKARGARPAGAAASPRLPRDHSRLQIARLLGGGSAGVWEGRRQPVCSHSAGLVINFSLGCH